MQFDNIATEMNCSLLILPHRTVKDFRRRTSQSILATVGSAETTKDEVFDVHIEKYDKMFLEMNERKLLTIVTIGM